MINEPYELKPPITFNMPNGGIETITHVVLWDGAHPCEIDDDLIGETDD